MPGKLIMCQGLPGAGKSTWAQTMENENDHVVRVNKDNIRRELHGGVWSKEKEKDVIAERDRRIEKALVFGYTVIVDDTNIARYHRVRLAEIAEQFGAEFEVKQFRTPIEECIKRDAQREGDYRVGEAVIRRMAKDWGIFEDYGSMGLIKVLPNPMLPPAVLCDLDGTIALHRGLRSPYDEMKCGHDLPNGPIRALVEMFYRFMGYNIIYCSARHEQARLLTREWLLRHHFAPGQLLMRQDGDNRKDWIVKGELFDTHVRGKFDVKYVLDDRNQVVGYWRALGLTCLQVANGDF